MKLYENYVNYSVFDGEITLDSSAREHLLSTMFLGDPTNKDITLLIDGIAYNARLMNVVSSKSVQVSYGSDVQAVFKKMFTYSDDYWTTIRQQAKAIGQSTRGLPIQTVESISLLETDTPLVYKVECFSYFNSENPYDRDNLESEESITFPEGKKAYAKHARYERNQGIVRLAKDRFKAANGALFCEVCGFSFDIYGERGKDYIEAHHDVPVSDLGDDGVSNIDDIKMVCANCHRILHRKRPWLKVDELKSLLQTLHI